MRIAALDFEIIRATPAVAEFLVRVELDASSVGYEITGRATGPHCPGVSTVEVSYLLTPAGAKDKMLSLRCVIPEPNLWELERPFVYRVMVELRLAGEIVATRSGSIRFRTN